MGTKLILTCDSKGCDSDNIDFELTEKQERLIEAYEAIHGNKHTVIEIFK